MTDAELSKAVADACGIEVSPIHDEFGVAYTLNGRIFNPPNDWNDAMHAADRFGLFTTHDASIEREGKLWLLVFYSDARDHADFVNHESGPRAICEAILAITKGTT